MQSKAAELRTGIVVVAASVALLLLLYYATGGDFFAPKAYLGLRVADGRLAPRKGDPILMNGLPIGTAESVGFRTEIRSGTALTDRDVARLENLLRRGTSGYPAPRAEEILGLIESGERPLPETVEVRDIYVFVTAKIKEGHPIPRGSHGIIAESITGQRALHIQPGLSQENIDLADAADAELPVIQVAQAPDVTDLMENVDQQLDRLGDDLARTLENLRGNLDKAGRTLDRTHDVVAKFEERVLDGGQITNTLDNVEAASASLRSALAEVESRMAGVLERVDEAVLDFRRIAGSGAGLVERAGEKIDGVLADLKKISGRLDVLTEKADPQILGLLEDARTVAANLATLSEDLKAVGPEVRTTIASAGVDVDRLLESLLETAQNLADASEDIRAHPWKLFQEPSVEEIAGENIRSAMLNYTRAMERADRAAANVAELLGRAEEDAAARELLKNALAQLETSLERSRHFEARLTELFRRARAPQATERGPPPPVRPR